MKKPARAIEVNDKVIALRNPKRETPAQFQARAERLYDQLEDHPERDELYRVEPEPPPEAS